MITLTFVFWMFVVLFAFIGAMRGWAKELLVIFSVILAIFIITVLYRYVPFVQVFLDQGGPSTKFWTFSVAILVLSFFGYQTPSLERFKAAARREKVQDTLFGFVLGGVNGYLIVGSIWAYLHEAGYFFEFVTPPVTEEALRLVLILPPFWLTTPAVYFAVAISLAFVLIVFI
jgi:uncharacterized membrane protein required for colicin V production